MLREPKTAVLLAIAVLACALYVDFAAGQVGDRDWLLLVTREWLGGKKLYVDLFEIDPPMIMVLYSVPVWLAAHFGPLKDYQLLVVLGAVLAAFSSYICSLLLRSHPAFAEHPRARMAHFWLLLLVWIAATNPAIIFDREHLFLVLVFPYLLRCMPVLDGAELSLKLRVVTALLAGVGFCIKPHCALLFIFVQGARLLHRRSLGFLFCLENLIIYVVAALYLGAIALFLPEYFNTMMPMAMATYVASGKQVNGLLYLVLALVLLGVAFADYRWRATSPYRRDIFYLLAIIPGFVAYALANNGWGYTYALLISFILVITGWAALEYRWFLAQNPADRSARFGSSACMLSLIAVIGFNTAFGLYTVNTGCAKNLQCSGWGRQLIAHMQGHHNFGAISSEFDIWTHLSDTTGASFDTRFSHFWMLPKFFLAGPDFAKRYEWIPRYVAGAYAQDLDARKPELVFVDNTDVLYLTPMHVDLVAYLSAYPGFRAAWAHYHHTDSVFSCSHPEKAHCSFDVYERLP